MFIKFQLPQKEATLNIVEKRERARKIAENIYKEIHQNLRDSTVSVYSLSLMSSLHGTSDNPYSGAENYRIYIDENSRSYNVLGRNGEMHQGIFPNTINLHNLSSRLDNLALKQSILDYTSAQGHTFAQEHTLQANKVAIIYSANNNQAQLLYDSYLSGKKCAIDGSGQAIIFHFLLEWIFKDGLQDLVHVLPIATSLRGGEDHIKNRVSSDMLKRDLANIRDHLMENWKVIALVGDEPTHTYKIGSGKSKHFYEKDVHPIKLKDKNLSQGEYVQKMLALLDASSGLDQTISDELGILLPVPHTLKYLIVEGLRLLRFSSQVIKYIDRVIFSPSYNLRIYLSWGSNLSAFDDYQFVKLDKKIENPIEKRIYFSVIENPGAANSFNYIVLDPCGNRVEGQLIHGSKPSEKSLNKKEKRM